MDSIGTRLALEVHDLSAGYAKRDVIHDLSMEIGTGEWCTLLGPNGVGKSTLLHAMLGTLPPRRGTVELLGFSTATHRLEALSRVGYACAPERLPQLLTGRQCLETYAAAKNLSQLDDEVIGLAAALNYTRHLDEYVDTHSLGTRQKLCVLLALLGAPSLIMLDEAFNGLDPASSLTLKRYLRSAVDAGRCSVLLATHSIDIVERFSDTAALLLGGRIVKKWTPDELLAAKRGDADTFESQLAAAATDGLPEVTNSVSLASV